MSVIQGTSIDSGAVVPAYTIDRSLRFRGINFPSATRLFAPTGITTGTVSFWLKRGTLATTTTAVVHSYLNSSTFFTAGFNNQNQFFVYDAVGGIDYGYVFTYPFRDASGHYYIQINLDSTNATATDRIRVYVNGTRLTAKAGDYGDPPLNYQFQLFITGRDNYIGFNKDQNTYIDGYLSEFRFLSGISADPSAFGSISSVTDQWTPKEYIGSYGTAGFYLDFKTGTNITTLFTDKSGNGNNWTATGFSLAADGTYDWSKDTISHIYPTMNPNDKATVANLQNGNLRHIGTTNGKVMCSIAIPPNGKFYAEASTSTATNNLIGLSFGVMHPSTARTSGSTASNSYHLYWVNGCFILNNGASTTATGWSNVTTGYKIAIDSTTNKVWLGQGAIWWDSSGNNTGNPATGANPTFMISGLTEYHLFTGVDAPGSVYIDVNYGDQPWVNTIPSGFSGITADSIPTPAIKSPTNHFDIVTYLGTGATKSITGLKFSPEFIWSKGRSANLHHVLMNINRGVGKYFSTSNNLAEVSNATTITSFDSAGYTFGTDSSNGVNQSGSTYVNWAWNAGGSPVSNTQGSITTQVSSNPTAGFSIVTYTGNTTAGATIGHDLGVPPELIIFKNLGAVSDCHVYHKSIPTPQTNLVYLNTTSASTSSVQFLNSTQPSASVITLGDSPGTNGSNMVALAFSSVAGYSKIGYYQGTGDIDGPFAYCGFKPRFIMVKCISAASTNWRIHDTKREDYNGINATLYPNDPNMEVAPDTILVCDIYSNGFKIRAINNDTNAAAMIYIYYAIAESSIHYATAR